MKFLINTAIFYAIYTVLEFLWDKISPLPGGDELSFDSIQRMIYLTIIVTIITFIWPAVKFFRKLNFSGGSGKLYWHPNKNFLIVSRASDFKTTGTPREIFVVKNFIYKGRNKSKYNLHSVNAYIKSRQTGLVLPLTLEGSGHAHDIPPDAEFFVMGPTSLPPHYQPECTIPEFLQNFGAFDFVFTYNQKTYKKYFTKDVVNTLLQKRVKELK